jgi:hypothetical protein
MARHARYGALTEREEYGMRMMTVVVTVMVVVLAFLMVPASAQATICWYDIDNVAHCQAGPVYYHVLRTEPDWCLYGSGDVVYVHTTYVNGTFIDDRWYVEHPSHYVTPPANYNGPWYVDSVNCSLFTP